MSELRLNRITGDWVIIAKERAKRPDEFSHEQAVKEQLPHFVAHCPFCPGNEEKTPAECFRLEEKGVWLIRSVPNKYSVLAPQGNIIRQGHGVQKFMDGFGLHEVIIETPKHDKSIALLPEEQVVRIMLTYQDRFHHFYRSSGIEYVTLFKNHGKEAGTSLEHPHSQIVGLPVMPGQVRDRVQDALQSYDEFGECLYCWTLQEELEDSQRIVQENESFVAFIPYAALSPFHLWIFPKKHNASFGHLTDSELLDLAVILQDVLWKLHQGLQAPDFNFVIRSLSPEEGSVKYFHWYLAIVPRLTKMAGFELGTGMYINSALPEESAAYLRGLVALKP